VKFHFLTQNQRLVTLSIVDLAGYPDQQATEINQSLNYLLYICRDLMFSGQSLHRHNIHDLKPSHAPKLNKSSIILTEFNEILALGKFKASFIHL
jgi:hypothetical protein